VVVRRWCRRRAAVAGRDSSAVRIRSNRKFHPLLGWERAALRTRLAVEQVDSPSRTKRRASASKRDRMPTVSPSRPQVRKRQRGGSRGDAAEAQPLRPRAVGVKAAAVAAAAATSSAPHDGWDGGWACKPDEASWDSNWYHPQGPSRRSGHPPREKPALFSPFATLRNERNSLLLSTSCSDHRHRVPTDIIDRHRMSLRPCNLAPFRKYQRGIFRNGIFSLGYCTS